ncbi:DUF3872 domain-containing protein [Myroides odoratus]|uniref:DUF based on B. Theta Gene description n=1 Tax=Myroides odoratus TaxID=256 RepID=A0A378RJS5_MYROD|nr:DUF3872 domain-containing protein [Myroides odoratus]QQU05240.1 DUF3872 domain-containing protein [Myroides odoratus]STZ27262.1 DUF based on B. Theta Gene description [Myroides odoratus]
MTTIFNKLKIGLLLLILSASFSLISCSKDDGLEIQNDFPFEINVMPVPKEVANGQTIEIRITIQRTGNYHNTQYYLRYFQFDGKGILRYYDNDPYLPNDLYSLPTEQFRLYYTSNSIVSQSFDIWISDSFGNEKQLNFQFNSIN